MPVRAQVDGDVTGATEIFIGQQCNCLTVKSHGLSDAIAKRFPYGNPYALRRKQSNNTAIPEDRPEPGTILLLKSDQATLVPQETKVVVCLFAQWCPGKPFAWQGAYPRRDNGEEDSAHARLEWFTACLKRIDESSEIDTPVALPFNIGCGLAGGNWPLYLRALEETSTDFVLYKL